MKIFNFFILFIVSSLLLVSCAFENLEDPTIILNLEDDIKLEVYPDLNIPDNLLWRFTSNSEKICENTELLTSQNKNNTGYTLFIDGLANPPNCEEGHFEVSSFETTRILVDNTNVNIILANILNVVEITRSTEAYNIMYNSTNGLEATSVKINKINPSYFWCSSSLITEQSQLLLKEIYSMISDKINIEEVPSGHYGYFTVREEMELVNPENFQKSNHGFVFSVPNYDSTVDIQISNLMSAFRENFPNFEFYLYNGSGKKF